MTYFFLWLFLIWLGLGTLFYMSWMLRADLFGITRLCSVSFIGALVLSVGWSLFGYWFLIRL